MIEGEPDPKTGMIIDFAEIEEALYLILPDHLDLNKFVDPNPTAERVGAFLFQKIKAIFPGLVALRLWESPEASVEVTA